MTEEEITDIVNMARNDPHFESMFDMIIEGMLLIFNLCCVLS